MAVSVTSNRPISNRQPTKPWIPAYQTAFVSAMAALAKGEEPGAIHCTDNMSRMIQRYGSSRLARAMGVDTGTPSAWAMRSRKVSSEHVAGLMFALGYDPQSEIESASEKAERNVQLARSFVFRRKHTKGAWCKHGGQCRWDDPPTQDARLLELLETMSTSETADELTREFGHPRTRRSVWQRVSALGEMTSRIGNGTPAAGKILGRSPQFVAHQIDEGRLAFVPITRRDGTVIRLVTDKALEQFIRTYPWLPNPNRMPRGRWRSLVDTLTNRGLRYLPVSEETARVLGCSVRSLRHRIEHSKLRTVKGFSRDGSGHVENMIDVQDIPTLREQLEEAGRAPCAVCRRKQKTG